MQSDLEGLVGGSRYSTDDADDACSGTPGIDLRSRSAWDRSDDELSIRALHKLDEFQAGGFVEESLYPSRGEEDDGLGKGEDWDEGRDGHGGRGPSRVTTRVH